MKSWCTKNFRVNLRRFLAYGVNYQRQSSWQPACRQAGLIQNQTQSGRSVISTLKEIV